MKQVLPAVKHGFSEWFSLLNPHLLLDTKGLLAALGAKDSTKVLGTDPSHWELNCSEFSGIFELPDTPPTRAIKIDIDLLLDCVAPAGK